MKIILPPQINAAGLLPWLTMLGTAANENVVIDFTHLRRVSPAALVALACAVAKWKEAGRAFEFRGLALCAITGYLQRMDLLSACGMQVPDTFRRHEARGRFVPVTLVDPPIEGMGHAMAACLAPGGDDWGHPLSALYDFAWYVLTETANNVRQHSGGIGYAAAQVTQVEGFVRMAIADHGRGIRRSFADAKLPWSSGMNDVDAIIKALEPRVSSKGTPTNEGVGLTLVSELARLAKAWLLIVSGRGLLRLLPDGSRQSAWLPNGGVYPGTLIGLTFKQTQVKDFAELLQTAKISSGLLPTPGQQGTFAP